MYYAKDLLDDPSVLKASSLTIEGLLSHGPSRYPAEWGAIIASKSALQRLSEYVTGGGHVVGSTARQLAWSAKATS